MSRKHVQPSARSLAKLTLFSQRDEHCDCGHRLEQCRKRAIGAMRVVPIGAVAMLHPHADDVEVEHVEFKDGLLTVTLKKELPEKQRRKQWF